MPPRVSTTPARPAPAFSVQPQEFPLNQQAITALENLKRLDVPAQNTTLNELLDRSAKLVLDSVGEINDRLSEERERRQARQQKLRRDGQEETEEEKKEFKMHQERVEALTKTMDKSVQTLVDDQQFSKNSAGWVQHVVDKTKEFAQLAQEAEEAAETARAAQAEKDLEEGTAQSPAQAPAPAPAQKPPLLLDPLQEGMALLHAAQSTATTEWNAQSLTQRYARNNTYADFYKMVWDSKNPGEHPPPLPDASMWFALQEGRNPARNTQRSTQRSATAATDDNEPDDKSSQATYEDDTEIQMTSAHRSVKCPLTMRYFTEPVTSTLCPHSFEKAAITTFIRESDKRAPLSAEQHLAHQRGRQCVQCPVPGCSVQTLTENDLRFDNVLLRMTKRAQEAEKREQEEDGNGPEELDDESDDGLPGGTQRKKKRKVFAIGSSPVRDVGRRKMLVKPERAVSIVPNSQSQSQSQIIPQIQSHDGGAGRGRGGFLVNGDSEDDAVDEDTPEKHDPYDEDNTGSEDD